MHLDTGVVVELFSRAPKDPLVGRIRSVIGDQQIFWSAVQFGELADVCRSKGRSIEDHAARVRSMADIVLVDEALAMTGSELKSQARKVRAGRDFSLIDGIILATARSRGQRLLTLDPEFSAFADVEILRD